MLTDEQIRALRDGCGGVTPGPWHVAPTGFGNKRKAPTVYHAGDDLNYIASFADFATFHAPPANEANAAHIARCDPQTISELCTRVLTAEANLRDSETRESEKAEALQARVKVLEEALRWYGEQTQLAKLIHSEGDSGRNALAKDGGDRARKALEEGK